MLTILSFLAVLICQNMSFDFASPLFINFKQLPIAFEAGYCAEYQVMSDQGESTYKVTIEAITNLEGKDYATISFSSDMPQIGVLTMVVPCQNPDPLKAREVRVKMPVGSFKIGNLTGILEKMELSSSKPEIISVLGSDRQLQKVAFIDSESREGIVWFGEGMGPLGIGKLQRYQKSSLVTYLLSRVSKSKSPSQ